MFLKKEKQNRSWERKYQRTGEGVGRQDRMANGNAIQQNT